MERPSRHKPVEQSGTGPRRNAEQARAGQRMAPKQVHWAVMAGGAILFIIVAAAMQYIF